MTPATTAKMPMQIAVANQYTNVIRSICLDAESGSHLINSATRVTAPAAANPEREMRKSEPLRTEARLHHSVSGGPRPRHVCEPCSDLRETLTSPSLNAHIAVA